MIDCMDCHNRPAHEFNSPQESVDLALSNGKIDRTLPYIKREAVSVLLPPHLPPEESHAQIAERLAGFYQENYPDLWKSRRASVIQAIETTQEIYDGNIFPYMNVDWTTYPDNIGHVVSAGCFRCHDNQHVNGDGSIINNTCETCHTFLLSESNGHGPTYQSGGFEHPVLLEGPHERLLCSQCHTGGASPSFDSCEGCHTQTSGLISATLPALEPYGIEADIMDGMVACDDCHSTTNLHSQKAAVAACADCHGDDGTYEEYFLDNVATLIDLQNQVQERIDANPDEAWAQRAHDILELLGRAGAHHNAEGSLIILEELLAAS